MAEAIGPGIRVQCISAIWNATPGSKPVPARCPQKGGVYTVSDVGPPDEFDAFGYLYLKEFPPVAGDRSSWGASQFRPFDGGNGRTLEETLEDMGLVPEKELA